MAYPNQMGMGMNMGTGMNNYYDPYTARYQQMTNPVAPQQGTGQQNITPLKGRMVGSVDEANASMIDFDGSVFYFPDVNKKQIYTKQIRLDGTVALNIYQLVEKPQNNFIDSNTFMQTIEELKNEIKTLKGGNSNAKQPAKQQQSNEFSF